jgi:hypothetical protein
MVYKPQVNEVTEEPVVNTQDTDEPLFVQNEEQLDSGLWTKTANAISQEEYTEVSRQEVVINEWLTKLRNKEITMADIPEHLLLEIRARR